MNIATECFIHVPLNWKEILVQARQLLARPSQRDNLSDGEASAESAEYRVLRLAIECAEERGLRGR